ncbi:MAG: hypothetical protein A2X48_13455 [Lentisphaerae bacterium GWF2_49_21]|nr:MAG: hypothetical protein A2X48_13455 [Lentisphaerae bacterium GWF2_49_21]
MAKLKQIAERTGMAVSTVSAVLSGKEYCYVSKEKKELVRKVAAEMGYVPNRMSRGLQGLSTDTVGVVGSLFETPVFSIMLARLNENLWDAGYSIMHGDSKFDPCIERRLINEFISRGIDGLIICSSQEKGEVEKSLGGRIPCVHVNRLNDGVCVSVDREKGEFMAVEHLISKHRKKKIGFLTASVDGNNEKYLGYVEAMKKHRIDCRHEWIIETKESGPAIAMKTGAEKIISLGLDAVVATNDIMAGNMIKYLQQADLRVPEDIAVVGFDGVDYICSLISPELTTVRHPTELVADKATELLISMMKGKKISKKKNIIEPELIIGRTCGCHARSE